MKRFVILVFAVLLLGLAVIVRVSASDSEGAAPTQSDVSSASVARK